MNHIQTQQTQQTKQTQQIESKPCDCTYCMQFRFARIRNHNYKKNITNTNKNFTNTNENFTNTNKNFTNTNENFTNTNKKFTLDDLDKVTLLKESNLDTKEISLQTNISPSIINRIINMLN